MGFDVSRAVAEALQSRLPFVDRLLSYLYFGDAAVLEQSTWDESGRGVTIVGRRGPGRPGGILLAAPLPLAATLADLPAGSPDVTRGLALLSMAWALASLEESDLSEPVTLVAARPDPSGTALRSVLESGTVSARLALAATPASDEARAPDATVVALSLLLDLPVRPLRAPLRDVVSWVHPAPGDALAALRDLAARLDDGSGVPLALEPGPGVHLGPVDRLGLTVGLCEPGPPPPGWAEGGRPSRVGGSGSCRPRLDALLAAAEAAGRVAAGAWADAGRPVPTDLVRLVDLGASEPSGATLGVTLPAEATGDVPASLEAALQALPGVDARALPVGGRVQPSSCPVPLAPGTASCLVGLVPTVLALGPGPGDPQEPAARARAWGARYRDAVRNALAPAGRSR